MKTSQKQSFNKSFLIIDEQIFNIKALGMLFKDEKKSNSNLKIYTFIDVVMYGL